MRDDQAASVLPADPFAGWSRQSSRRCALVVAGEAALRALAASAARERGWAVEACATGTDAVLRLSSQPPSVLIYAEPLPDMPASQLWRAAGPSVRFAVRLVTDDGSASGVGAATGGKPGVTPPHVQTFDASACPTSIGRALTALDGIEVPPAPAPQVCIAESDDEGLHGLVGATPVMRDLLGLVRRLAPHVRTALIVGEPGSGKESIARVLHRVGPRAAGRFMTLDCASLGDAATETFGVPWLSARHAQAWGVFHEAAGGVLFLDAVGDLTATAQGRLLTALEARGFAGAASGADPRAPDVHVFAASSRDLRPDVASGRFRRDLFYHLSVVELRVPSLRERRGDVARLACSFLRATGHRVAHGLDGFTEDAEALLTNAPWEGNVSELRALVERVSMLAEGPLVTAREVLACLPEHLAGHGAAVADRDARERAQTLAALEEAGGNKKAAAQRLGLSRRAFYRRLERLAMADTIARRPVRRLAS